VQTLGRLVYQQAMVHFQGAHLVTVMELCSTDLHSVLYTNDFPLLPSVIKRLLHDLLKGVHVMHSHGALFG
jgi:serine/threonine protein kinase